MMTAKPRNERERGTTTENVMALVESARRFVSNVDEFGTVTDSEYLSDLIDDVDYLGDAPEASEKTRLYLMEQNIVRLLSHELDNGDDKTADQLVQMILDDWVKLRNAVRRVVTQSGDDVCWRDIYTELAGLVGIKFCPQLMVNSEQFIANCRQFDASLRQSTPYTPAHCDAETNQK